MWSAYLAFCQVVGFVVVTGCIGWLVWFIGYLAYWGWREHRYTNRIYRNWRDKNATRP